MVPLLPNFCLHLRANPPCLRGKILSAFASERKRPLRVRLMRSLISSFESSGTESFAPASCW